MYVLWVLAKTSSEGYYNFSKTEDEIISAIRSIEESGIPRVSCSGAYGFDGKHAVQAAKLVKENTKLELLINVGSDLNMMHCKNWQNTRQTRYVVIWKN